MRLHPEGDDVICDVCKVVLQTISDPIVLEEITLYLLDLRARRRVDGKKKAKKHES